MNRTYVTVNRPFVEEANLIAPTFARIFKEMIIITDPSKPLPRAAKSTVMRKLAIAAYQKEIDDLWVLPNNICSRITNNRYTV